MTVHSEKRVICHRPEDLYALVANVRDYPEFLPWCLASRIRYESPKALTADLIIGFNMFRERFTSYVE
ncbi:MAG: SRPBCC family protein, partial [Candidatus Puniceispirillaceae bacterium]